MASLAEKATAARVLKDAGRTPEEIAELLSAGVSTVYRWLKDNPQPVPSTACEDLEALLATQDLDAQGRFNAGVARRLAQRLDNVAVSTKAADAMAMPQIAKELRAVVDEIMDVSSDDKEWLANVFTPVGNPKDGDT